MITLSEATFSTKQPSSGGIVPSSLTEKTRIPSGGIVPPMTKQIPSGGFVPPGIQKLEREAAVPVKTEPTQTWPSGSIQWMDKKGVWHYAIPKTKSQKMAALSGYSAVSPILGCCSLQGTHQEVGAGVLPIEGVETVSEEDGKKATTPFYKKAWFIAAVGLSVVGLLGFVGYLKYKK